MHPFLDRLGRGETIVGDGAWGTLLMERGLEAGQAPETFNLTRPEVLVEIGNAYLEAGAEILTANTFGASSLKLRSHGLEAEAGEVNRRAVTVLRDLAAGRAYIAASVGPSGAILKPYGDTDEDQIYAAFQGQIEAQAEAGTDLIWIETMIDLREASLAIRAARNVAPELPVIATMTFDPTPRGFFTIMGTSLEQAAEGLEEAGADAIGSNCGNGSETMVEIAEMLRSHTRLPLVIQPNAGLPENRAGTVVYPENPRFMARQALRLVEIGVAVIGGCCGTTPEHVRAICDDLVRREGGGVS
jgi:5-methyltetrahydrofolate--homocysteine methyltransferase